jgi:hypothetical protein
MLDPSNMIAEVVKGIWVDSGPVRIVGTKLTATMTVVRLEDGLLVHSPLPLSPERRAAVSSLGKVTHLYAPNTFHHAWLLEWNRAFPEALVHAPAPLQKKRPDVRIDQVHGDGPLASAAELEEIPILGFRLVETALFHRASGTVIVADLVHNIGRPTDRWTKIYATLMGFYDRVALSRVLRWTAFDDRRAARASVDRLLSLPFDRLVVGHGTPLASGAHELLATAMRFLPAADPRRLSGRSKSTPIISPKPCG